MSEECAAKVRLFAEHQQKLRQFVHDCRSPLSVICTGLEAVEMACTDRENFTLLCRMMQKAANELKEQLAALAAMSTADFESTNTPHPSA